MLARPHARPALRLAVATSKPEQLRRCRSSSTSGLAEFFETVGGDELDGSLPTKALVIDKVLERLGRPTPDDVLMVGDRAHDVLGAREHGIALRRRRLGLRPAGRAGAGRRRSGVRARRSTCSACSAWRCRCCSA